MSENRIWRRRAAMVIGVLIAGLSFYSVVRLSSAGLSGDTDSRDGPTNLEGQSSPLQRDSTETIRIGWSAWADAEVVSLMAKALIENHYNKPVDLVMADIGIQYEAVARGDLDLMLMAWLPKTHKDYWSTVWDRVIDLGPMYSGRLGWVVPDYVPEQKVASLSNLAEAKIAKGFKNRIQGIDPGSGLMQMSQTAMKDYKLVEMKLVSASGAAMTAVLDKSIREQEWVVVTGWTPHWMFARYPLRFLEDPKGVFGGREGIHALARMGLDQDHPKVVNLLSRFRLRDQELSALLLDADKTSPEQAVSNYLSRNKTRVTYWVTGAIAEP
ncbi:MAG: glycine betaine ABC transporter substrate-binding protein [Prochlorococcus sp.]